MKRRETADSFQLSAVSAVVSGTAENTIGADGGDKLYVSEMTVMPVPETGEDEDTYCQNEQQYCRTGEEDPR